MGYSLQYCTNECGNAVPGNECDWEDGVCDACRERREDEAKGETMAGWTPKDTEALLDESHAYAEWAAELTEGGSAGTSEDARLAELFARAAAHIEALEARVAELEAPAGYADLGSHASDLRELRACQGRIATLEAELADTIPRAVLVGSLRKRLRQATAPGAASCSSDMRRDAIAETLRGLIREIERGEWPGEGER
jgi:BMFP domain-containing protein YqiC